MEPEAIQRCRYAAQGIDHSICGVNEDDLLAFCTRDDIAVLLAEYDRLRAVEAAARAYCDLTPDRADETPAPLLFAKLQDALAAKERA